MAKKKINELQKIIRTGLVLIGVASFIAMIMGYASIKLNEEVKAISYFNEQNQNIELNFEQSLTSYTQSVGEAILAIDGLLPADESEIIAFITAVESMSENQGLNINLQSRTAEEGVPIIPYQVDFFGAKNQLILFVEELEALPYYTNVTQVSFQDLDLVLSQSRDEPQPNISINFDLYVE